MSFRAVPLLLLLSACSVAGRRAELAPPPAAAQYRIAAQDVLDIAVYGEPDLTRSVRVSGDGKINFPLVGEVELAGLEPAQAEAKLREGLLAKIVDPYVSVSVKEQHSRRVVILGEVQKPGAYDIPPNAPLSAVEAIALAGGFTKYAAPNKTRVVRKGANGQETFLVPVNDVTKGDKSKDVVLQPEDVVSVPQSIF